MFVTNQSQRALADEINAILTKRTHIEHFLFECESEIWTVTISESKFYIIGCDPRKADLTLHYYDRPIANYPDHALQSNKTTSMSLDDLFRQMNTHTGPLGFELYRVSGSKLIIRDLVTGHWYNIDFTYSVSPLGYVDPVTCNIVRGDHEMRIKPATILPKRDRWINMIDYD